MKILLKTLLLFALFLSLSSASGRKKNQSPRAYFNKVLRLIEKGDYMTGSRELYRLSRGSFFKSRRSAIKYTLGIAFLEMKLYHLASLQFVYVIKKAGGTYKEKAIKKLALVLSHFENDRIFCTLKKHIKEWEYPLPVRDQMMFYFGSCAFDEGKFRLALRYFSKVGRHSPFRSRALYHIGLAHAERNKVKQAVEAFRDMSSMEKGITDTNRVAALMGLARVLYQGGRFGDSIKIYRSIPKDTVYFHEALLENSWNYLRSGRFRSALSNFQTLHSVFYKNRYQPESLILRAYVYLYICRYDEMEKTLNLFKAVYRPVFQNVRRSLKWSSSKNAYLKAVLSAHRNREQGLELSDGSVLPQVVMDRVLKSPTFRSMVSYLEKLQEEKLRLDSLPRQWRRDKVGRNASYILKRRIASTRKSAGSEVKKTLSLVYKDLQRLFESEEYLRYDMLKGKREKLKQKIARKYLNKQQIDETVSRSYYIQNGYEYWPFDGESWLDELGNYHYLGQQNCE